MEAQHRVQVAPLRFDSPAREVTIDSEAIAVLDARRVLGWRVPTWPVEARMRDHCHKDATSAQHTERLPHCCLQQETRLSAWMRQSGSQPIPITVNQHSYLEIGNIHQHKVADCLVKAAAGQTLQLAHAALPVVN